MDKSKTKLNWDKMKALVHLICHKADDSTNLGSIKLNKVLWYADIISYVHSGNLITGETYIKRQFGPVPKHIVAIKEMLEKEEKIIVRKGNFLNSYKEDLLSMKNPDIHYFVANDLLYIEQAFDHVCLKHTARSISEETHDDIWELAEIGEEIPPYTIFASSLAEVDEFDMEWAKEKLANDI